MVLTIFTTAEEIMDIFSSVFVSYQGLAGPVMPYPSHLISGCPTFSYFTFAVCDSVNVVCYT